ncbi:DUF1643 domain-containing protein [Sphingomonas sp. T9W2]|uniref:DUF1643 domain-containing protein n=1 Tax=Sphingomonas sp. T9W2 TaxID=3143183 RepID=UPI0031F4C975
MRAVISDCGLYRYRLERLCQGGGVTGVIMVNPSTADGSADDHTIRKLRGFGDRNEWGRLLVGNLFAYRATDVRELANAADPIGPLNDGHLNIIFGEADRVVFAWGPVTKQPPGVRHRWMHVARMATSLGHQPLWIGPVAKCGHPKHPLTLAYSLPLSRWTAPSA